MPPLKAEACLLLSSLMRRAPRETPCSSSITLTEPRPLTCEAAGLARAHGAEQSQQGQPEGPEHGRAVAGQLRASPEQQHKGAWAA